MDKPSELSHGSINRPQPDPVPFGVSHTPAEEEAAVDMQPCTDGERPQQKESQQREKYKKGQVIEISGENEDEGFSGMAKALGALSGATLLGCTLGILAGPAIALSGAAVGAVTGTIAGAAIAREWARGESTVNAMDFDQPGQEAEGPGEESGEVIADIGRQSPSAIGASLTAEERGRCEGVSL